MYGGGGRRGRAPPAAAAAKWLKLAFSVVIDLLGVATYLVPGVGELGDVAWAPTSALLVQALYGNALLSSLAFVEEALPFTDFVPTACLGWALAYTSLGEHLGTWRRGRPRRE